MKNSHFFKTSILCVSVLLSACGGSDSDSDDNPQTVRINDLAEVSVPEASTAEFQTQNEIKSITAIDGSTNLKLSFLGRSLSIEVGELNRPAIGTYDIYMSKGKDTVIQRYEVLGLNSSAVTFENIAYDIRDNYQSLLNLAEDKKVYNFFIDLGYLQETITPAKRDTRIADFDATESSFYASTQGNFDRLLEVFDKYLNQEVGESTLKASANLAAESLASHGSYGLTKLREAEDISLTYMKALPNDEIAYVRDKGRFSRFFATSMLTTDKDSAAIYATGYEILTPLTGRWGDHQ